MVVQRVLQGIALSIGLTGAAQAQVNPTGIWRCVMNSVAVSIDVTVQVNPDSSLLGQGTIVYNSTSAIYQIRAGGRWMAGTSPETGRFTYQFALQPSNHASFSLFTEPTGDPYALYQVRPNRAQGGMTETACSRLQ